MDRSAQVQAFAPSSSAGFYTDANFDILAAGVWSMQLVVTYAGDGAFLTTTTEQFDIFRRIVRDVQDESKFGAGWDMGIDCVWDTPSGVLRDLGDDYRFFKAKNAGEAMRQMGAFFDDGFDYAETQYQIGSDGRIDKNLRLFYPRQGRTTNFVYEYDTSPGVRSGPARTSSGESLSAPDTFAWAGDGWGSGNDETHSSRRS